MGSLGDGVKKVLLAGIGTAAVTAEKSKEVLDKMAERAACTQLENERLRELNEVAKGISYGNVHAGVSIQVNRISEVKEEMVEQYDAISGPLLTISRQLQKSLMQQLLFGG